MRGIQCPPSRHNMLSTWLFAVFGFLCWCRAVLAAQWLGERSLPELSYGQIKTLVTMVNPSKNLDPDDPKSHLSRILIPRPVDTENNTLVRNYIIDTMKALNWDIEEDSFVADTPYGPKRFTNVIATKDPEAPRRVVLSAHFDSKFFSNFPENQFVGATDSAMPCALMLDLAETLNPLLDRRKEQLETGEIHDEDVGELTLQLVFFDGEEAFQDWTHTDSVYGARHLAEKWATTYIQPYEKRRLRITTTELASIEHLILLDLLGAKNPLIQSFFLDTAWLFDAMADSERRVAASGVLGLEADVKGYRSFFLPRRDMRNMGFIEDDHLPFMQRGVSILHVIAHPFPRVWHTIKDDASALDMETMVRWNLIMRVFMSEYLGLQPDEADLRIKRDNGDLVGIHALVSHPSLY